MIRVKLVTISSNVIINIETDAPVVQWLAEREYTEDDKVLQIPYGAATLYIPFRSILYYTIEPVVEE
jgi:hypothetical protein